MINSRMNLKIVRASAWYDLVVTSALMTPWTAAMLLALLAILLWERRFFRRLQSNPAPEAA